ncbi:MAG: hypothetical protein E7316_01345 [Clostridiales bacterium]|nr:hypothetical protein [Clostridiales bacterium]
MQPRERRADKRSRKKKTQLILVIALALILIAAIVTGVLLLLNDKSDAEYERYQFDTDAIAGRIQRMSEEEIQQELNRVVEEGMFNISIASAIVFTSPEAEGQARIENTEANHYHMQVDIFLDETGELVYASKLLQPGYSIENIRLTSALAPGEYNATAVFSAITQEEMQLFGQAAAQIKLYIMDENGRIPTPTPLPAQP